MELKSRSIWQVKTQLWVLIVPLWNWNESSKLSTKLAPRSNCTFMELKWANSRISLMTSKVLIVPLWNWNTLAVNKLRCDKCSNCTFMELKCGRSSRQHPSSRRSNCTFMELKFQKLDPKLQPLKVLIVPLWNWNTHPSRRIITNAKF